MQWNVLDTGKASAEENMRIDRELLASLGKRERPLLHFYEWEKESATYGYFVRIERLINMDKAKERNLDLARRPTGGGIVFHIWDFAFSVLIPASHSAFSLNPLASYAFVNERVKRAISFFLKADVELANDSLSDLRGERGNFCMAKPTKYDVMWQGKKIAGAAQRRVKDGLLHQGTIALSMPSKDLLQEVLCIDASVIDAMFRYTFPLLEERREKKSLKVAKEELKEHLLRSMQ